MPTELSMGKSKKLMHSQTQQMKPKNLMNPNTLQPKSQSTLKSSDNNEESKDASNSKASGIANEARQNQDINDT